MDMIFAQLPGPETALEVEAESVPLTIDRLNALKMGAAVWIEERRHPWEKVQTEVMRYFRLFPARLIWTGIPIGRVLRNYHFSYVYKDGKTYTHKRTAAFYGKEWRVWIGKPTDEQKEATQWLS